MKRLLFILAVFLTSTAVAVFGQENIPLGNKIRVCLTSKDTTLRYYNIYSFVRMDSTFRTKGKFMVLKNEDNYFMDQKEINIKFHGVGAILVADNLLERVLGCFGTCRSIENSVGESVPINFDPRKPDVVLMVYPNEK